MRTLSCFKNPEARGVDSNKLTIPNLNPHARPQPQNQNLSFAGTIPGIIVFRLGFVLEQRLAPHALGGLASQFARQKSHRRSDVDVSLSQSMRTMTLFFSFHPPVDVGEVQKHPVDSVDASKASARALRRKGSQKVRPWQEPASREPGLSKLVLRPHTRRYLSPSELGAA